MGLYLHVWMIIRDGKVSLSGRQRFVAVPYTAFYCTMLIDKLHPSGGYRISVENETVRRSTHTDYAVVRS